MNVEQIGPLRADEFGRERVDEFDPRDADEDVVQEAEELMHVPAPILPSKAEVESHTFHICPSEVGALRVSVTEDSHLVSKSRHENKGGRTDTDCLRGLWVLRAS